MTPTPVGRVFQPGSCNYIPRKRTALPCAKADENGNFILMHSVGSYPENREIDVPLNYADYYFLEALLRYRSIYGSGK